MLVLNSAQGDRIFVLIPGVPPFSVKFLRARGDKIRLGFDGLGEAVNVVREAVLAPEDLAAHAATLGGEFDAWLVATADALKAARVARCAAGLPVAPETEVELAEGCRILPASLVQAIREAEEGTDADAA